MTVNKNLILKILVDNFASRAVPELEHQRLNLTGENERLQHTIFIFDALHFVARLN